MKQSRLAERLGIEVPLIQAPMAAVSTPEMAAAVSNAGRGLAGPLGVAAAKSGSDDFSTMWAGQAAALGREMPAGELVMTLMDEASAVLKGLRA